MAKEITQPTPMYFGEESKPYCCPICNGKGIVPNGFYLGTSKTWTTPNATPEKCKSCNGTGIVWKP